PTSRDAARSHRRDETRLASSTRRRAAGRRAMTEAPTVTDHAVLRYLERVLGFDIEGARRLIEEECAVGLAMRASAVVKGGVTSRLPNGRVLTVHATGKGRISETDKRRAQQRIEVRP